MLMHEPFLIKVDSDLNNFSMDFPYYLVMIFELFIYTWNTEFFPPGIFPSHYLGHQS